MLTASTQKIANLTLTVYCRKLNIMIAMAIRPDEILKWYLILLCRFRAYFHSAATLNYVRAILDSGFAGTPNYNDFTA